MSFDIPKNRSIRKCISRGKLFFAFFLFLSFGELFLFRISEKSNETKIVFQFVKGIYSLITEDRENNLQTEREAESERADTREKK